MKFSDIPAILLRSSFYWLMGAGTMLIEVIGRKTGRPIYLPVNYYKDGLVLWVVSSRERVWWRNLQANPNARLWIANQVHAVHAEVITDEAEVAQVLVNLFEKDAMLARALHYQPSNPLSLQRAAEERLVVRLSTLA